MKKYHRLLSRQLKKIDLDHLSKDDLELLFDKVSDAYTAFDGDMAQLENTLEKSSQELFEANQQLRSNVEAVSQQLEQVAENIKEVIFEMDTHGQWTYLNHAWEKLTSTKIADSLGKPYHHSFKDHLGFPLDDFLGLNDTEIEVSNKKIEVKAEKLGIKWLDFSLKSIKSKEGTKQGFIGTIVDITRLKESELALIKAKEKETKANRAKDEFLSTMSHEIRTPLNAVIGVSNLLLLEDPKPEQMEYLTALKDSSEHLLGLVNDILDFNKIASGSIIFEQRCLSLHELIRRQQNIFQQNVKEKNLSFDVRIDALLPRLLVGDTVRISQIFTNLIGNAIKFTEMGGVFVSLDVLRQNEELCEVLFEVSDTGIGIPKRKLGAIFRSFEQADLDTTRKYGGTGLGLAICKRLLQLLDSDLKVESQLGQGSKFFFTLKFKKENRIKALKNTVPYTTIGSGLQGSRILVAEDNKVNTMVIKKFLEKWKVDFHLAPNGKIAQEMASQNRYDMILMDLQMPVMNGYEASSAIRTSKDSLNSDIPIYALSASTRMASRNDIFKYGMNGLITKPFNPEELYQTLNKILNDEGISITGKS